MNPPTELPLTRRSFMAAAAGSGVVAAVPSCLKSGSGPPQAYQVPGRIVGGSHDIGHWLYEPPEKMQDAPPETHTCDTVIVGGGVSGLCAAWKLRKSGLDDFVILELEPWSGGNSAYGQSADTEFQWAAHYLNVPPAEADCVKEVLEDLGVIQGYDDGGRPQIGEEHFLRWPEEHLFIDGKWTEWDLLEGASAREREALLEFEDDMLTWTLYKGRDGRRAFTLPLRYSTTDTRVRRLDGISMKEYVRSKGWNSPRLDWAINYACRDDYGSTMDTVSAWAGIHYFACRYYDRRVKKEYPADTLTWPAGNGYLVQKLAEGLTEAQLRLGCAVLRVENEKSGVTVSYYGRRAEARRSITARTVIYAAKLYTAPFVVAGMPDDQQAAIRACDYSSWLTAAVHVARLPAASDISVAWDNVIYDSESLGYIVANHQDPKAHGGRPTVLVYYLPFVGDLVEDRQKLLDNGHEFWVNVIMNDLVRVHSDLAETVERIDVYRWGHAMIRPGPGTIWSAEGARRAEPVGAVYFATCDVTGLPLFEESCFAGIRAAEQAMGQLGKPFETSIKGLDRV